jgi:hypothetical protein
MRHIDCSSCGESIALGQSFAIAGKNLCAPCGQKFLDAAQPPLTKSEVRQNVDPTVCALCGADGDVELGRIGPAPVCGPCEERRRNWPYPAWIKISAAVVLLLAVVSLVMNWRFMAGFVNARAAGRAIAQGDLQRATDLIERARDQVPENKQFRVEADMFRGLLLLKQGKEAEALPYLERSVQFANDPRLHRAHRHAKMSVAFDEKNYDLMLSTARAEAAALPNDPLALYAVASACACKFAAEGLDEFKQQALESIAKGDAAGGQQQPDSAAFRQRILYRIHAREIIDGEEFDKRFPQGWQEPR